MIPQAGTSKPERKPVLPDWEWADMPKYEKITAPEASPIQGQRAGANPRFAVAHKSSMAPYVRPNHGA